MAKFQENLSGNSPIDKPRNKEEGWPRGESAVQSQSFKNSTGSSFAARFGRAILKDGIAAIPAALYHFQGKLGLSAQQVWFISYILSHKWDDDLPYPSIAQMARCTGVSDRMLRYRCNELHHMRYLQIYPRYHEDGGQGSNYYDLTTLFEQLEEVISHEAPRPNPIKQGEVEASPRPMQSGQIAQVAQTAGVGVAQVVQPDSSFLARYGRVILGYGIASVPKALFTHQKSLGLTAQQVWFTCYILSFQWETALPYPSINRMAERTGYSKQQLHIIKGELVARGYLRIERRYIEGGGNDTSLYDFSPLFDAIRAQLEPGAKAHDSAESEAELSDEQLDGTQTEDNIAATARRRHRPSQPKYARTSTGTVPGDVNENEEAANNGAAIELTRGTATEFTTPTATGFTTWAATKLTSPHATGLTGEAATQLPIPDNQAAWNPPQQGLPGGRKAGLPKVDTIKAETFDKDDSNHLSHENIAETERPRSVSGQNNRSSTRAYSHYIAGVVTDFSDELGDAEHIISNVSRTLRLWGDSGLDEKEFVDVMYVAKKRTRAGQGMHGSAGLNNKMAYFYTVLRQLLENPAR